MKMNNHQYSKEKREQCSSIKNVFAPKIGIVIIHSNISCVQKKGKTGISVYKVIVHYDVPWLYIGSFTSICLLAIYR